MAHNQQEKLFKFSSTSTPKTSNHPLINAKLVYKLLAISLQKQLLLRCNFSVQPICFPVHLRLAPASVYFSSFSTQFGPINYVEANLKLSIYLLPLIRSSSNFQKLPASWRRKFYSKGGTTATPATRKLVSRLSMLAPSTDCLNIVLF